MFYKSENHSLYYELSGNGDKTILFLHGWGCDGSIFNKTSIFFENKFKILKIDFPGHGKSDEPIYPFYVKDFAENIVLLLKYLDIDSVNIVAHSFGARVAIWLASHNSNLVEKIVITGGAGIKPNSNKKLSKRTKTFKIIKKYLMILKKIKILEKSAEFLLEKAIQKYGSSDYVKLSKSMRSTFSNIVNEDLTPYLSKINVPTILIWGDQDKETPLEFGKIMEQNIKDSALIIFENAGHFAFLEQPNRFNIILKSFFEDN